MALAAGYIMIGISLALLITYGADVAVGGGAGGDGFIPLSSAVRGMVFGAPPIALSIAAYFVARKDPSIVLGGLIILAGVLIIVGGAMALQGSSRSRGGIPHDCGGRSPDRYRRRHNRPGRGRDEEGNLRLTRLPGPAPNAALMRQRCTTATTRDRRGTARSATWSPAPRPHRAMSWFESAIQPVLDAIAGNVYPGVFLAALLETIIPPIPSEIIFPPGRLQHTERGNAGGPHRRGGRDGRGPAPPWEHMSYSSYPRWWAAPDCCATWGGSA